MSHVTHLFTVYILVTQTQSQQQGGWTPISNAEVLRRLKLFIPKPNITVNQRMDTGWNPNNAVDIDIVQDIRENAITLVKPQELLGNFTVKSDDTLKKPDDAKLQSVPLKNPADLPFSEKRKAKTLKNLDNIENSVKEKQDKGDKRRSDSDKTTLEENESISYEVTEQSESADAFRSTENFIQNSGYVYKPPQYKKAQRNLTQTFLNILGKYRINPKDELNNYTKSRVPKKHESIRPQVIYLPIPIHTITRSNNNNHLPVDPLIAVFLSNYGHYLPYSYGVHNNYRNLYGYLASNNIHNNKPFGPYKIFSDTDSSSK